MIIIKNESDYEKASEKAEQLYKKKPAADTPEKTELDELTKALKEYENDFIRMLKENS
jgi:antitoxin component HigA of HigAB toxin-antitoxin module